MSTRSDFAAGKVSTRSYVLCVVIGFSYNDFVTTVVTPIASLPPGAVVVAGYLNVTTAWNITTSTIDIGYTGDLDEYTSTPLDLESATAQALTITGYQVIVGVAEDIQATIISTAPTAGEANVFLNYVDTTKADENFE